MEIDPKDCLQPEPPLQGNQDCNDLGGDANCKSKDGGLASADGEFEVLRQVSSLVAKYQEQAMTEKQSRVFAQLQALEKDRIATDAWKIITALKKDKFELERKVEKLKGHNQKLFEFGANHTEINSTRECKNLPEGLSSVKKHTTHQTQRDTTEGKEGGGIKATLMEFFRRAGSHKSVMLQEDGKQMVQENTRKVWENRSHKQATDEWSSVEMKGSEQETNAAYRDPCPGVCGLENVGNTCFMNAGLQCLFAVQPFCRFFLSGCAASITNKCADKSQQALIDTFGALMAKVWSGCYLACDTSELYRVIKSTFQPQLSPLLQHDCHEFLALFLDQLHQEFNTAKRKKNVVNAIGTEEAEDWWSKYTDLNESVIVDTFQGQFQNKVTCYHCQYMSVAYQAFSFLSVPLSNEVQHTFVVTYMSQDSAYSSKDEPWAKRYKVQVNKPSTVLKLKLRFLSMLSPDERPELEKLKVAMVRDNCILRVLADKRFLTPFKDSDTKLYAFVPLALSPSNNQLDKGIDENPVSGIQPSNTTAFYSPLTSTLAYMSAVDNIKKDSTEMLSTSGYMSALDRVENKAVNEVGFLDAEKPIVGAKAPLMSHNTSTPKKVKSSGRAGVASPYRLSYTCSECLQEVADQADIFHGEAVVCKDCRNNNRTRVDDNIDKERSMYIPVVFRRTDPSSKEIRLYGHPILVMVPEKVNGRGLYKHLLMVLNDAYKLQFLPSYNLYLVNFEGRRCSRCTRSQGCDGCTIFANEIVTFQSHDHIAVEIDNIDLIGLEMMRRFVEDKSMSKDYKESSTQLQDCINEFVEREKLQDPWKCPRCCGDQGAAKTTTISRYPDTLIVHLKRYINNGGKISLPVSFPLEGLNLRDFTQTSQSVECVQGRGAQVYDLLGCVCHEGAHDRGHYTAYTRYGNTDLWYKYDDTKVTKASPDISCSSAVYVLFYRKRPELPLTKSGTASETSGENISFCHPVGAEKEISRLVEGFSGGSEETDDQQTGKMQQEDEKCCKQNSVSKETNNLSCARDSLKLKQRVQKKKKRSRKEKGKGNLKPRNENSISNEPNQCGCNHCQYLKELEKQMKKAKLASGAMKQLREEQVPQQQATARKTNVKAVKIQQNENKEHERNYSPTTQSATSAESSSTAITAGVQATQPTAESAVQVTLMERGDEKTRDTINEQQPSTDIKVTPTDIKVTPTDIKVTPTDIKVTPTVEHLTRKLIRAVEKRDIRRAVCFLKRGADPSLVLDGASAFHLATGMNSSLSFSFSRLFLDYGGDPNVKTSDGLTPVHVAAMWGRTDCLKLLIDRGGDPYEEDSDGLNAVDLARAFEEDTSADTSLYLSKLDEHYATVMNSSSFSTVSLSSHSFSEELPYPYCPASYWQEHAEDDNLTPPFPVDSSSVGCGSWVSGLGNRMSGSLRRSSSRLLNGLRNVRSAFSFRNSDSDKS